MSSKWELFEFSKRVRDYALKLEDDFVRGIDSRIADIQASAANFGLPIELQSVADAEISTLLVEKERIQRMTKLLRLCSIHGGDERAALILSDNVQP